MTSKVKRKLPSIPQNNLEIERKSLPKVPMDNSVDRVNEDDSEGSQSTGIDNDEKDSMKIQISPSTTSLDGSDSMQTPTLDWDDLENEENSELSPVIVIWESDNAEFSKNLKENLLLLLKPKISFQNFKFRKTTNNFHSDFLKLVNHLNVEIVLDSEKETWTMNRHWSQSHKNAFIHILPVYCSDKGQYKNRTRNLIRNWIGIMKEKDFEHIILYIPPESKKRTLLNTKSVFDKIRADYKDRVLKLSIKKGIQPTAMDEYAELIQVIKEGIVKEFSKRSRRYHEEITKWENMCDLPGWQFCHFFLIKEGLAFTYECIGAYGKSLVIYHELKELLSRRENPFEMLIDTTEKSICKITNTHSRPYRRMIYRCEISKFDFWNYLFAREISLLIKLQKPEDAAIRALQHFTELYQSTKSVSKEKDFQVFLHSWSYSNLRCILEVCQKYIFHVDLENHLKSFFGKLGDLFSLTRYHLQSLGKIHKMIHGWTEFKIDKDFDWKAQVSCPDENMNHTELNNSETGFGIADSLMECLKSQEKYDQLLLELSSAEVSAYKNAEKFRIASKLRYDISSIRYRQNHFQDAAEGLQIYFQELIEDGWDDVATEVCVKLCECQRLSGNVSEFLESCLFLLSRKNLHHDIRTFVEEKFNLYIAEALADELHHTSLSFDLQLKQPFCKKSNVFSTKIVYGENMIFQCRPNGIPLNLLTTIQLNFQCGQQKVTLKKDEFLKDGYIYIQEAFRGIGSFKLESIVFQFGDFYFVTYPFPYPVFVHVHSSKSELEIVPIISDGLLLNSLQFAQIRLINHAHSCHKLSWTIHASELKIEDIHYIRKVPLDDPFSSQLEQYEKLNDEKELFLEVEECLDMLIPLEYKADPETTNLVETLTISLSYEKSTGEPFKQNKTYQLDFYQPFSSSVYFDEGEDEMIIHIQMVCSSLRPLHLRSHHMTGEEVTDLNPNTRTDILYSEEVVGYVYSIPKETSCRDLKFSCAYHVSDLDHPLDYSLSITLPQMKQLYLEATISFLSAHFVVGKPIIVNVQIANPQILQSKTYFQMKKSRYWFFQGMYEFEILPEEKPCTFRFVIVPILSGNISTPAISAHRDNESIPLKISGPETLLISPQNVQRGGLWYVQNSGFPGEITDVDSTHFSTTRSLRTPIIEFSSRDQGFHEVDEVETPPTFIPDTTSRISFDETKSHDQMIEISFDNP